MTARGDPQPRIKPSARSIRDQADTVVSLRQRGWTYQQIGDFLGLTKQRAHQLDPARIEIERPSRRERYAQELVGSAGNCVAPPYPEHQYVSRDPCGWCGVKANIGCRHYPLDAHAERQISAISHRSEIGQGAECFLPDFASVNGVLAKIP